MLGRLSRGLRGLRGLATEISLAGPSGASAAAEAEGSSLGLTPEAPGAPCSASSKPEGRSAAEEGALRAPGGLPEGLRLLPRFLRPLRLASLPARPRGLCAVAPGCWELLSPGGRSAAWLCCPGLLRMLSAAGCCAGGRVWGSCSSGEEEVEGVDSPPGEGGSESCEASPTAMGSPSGGVQRSAGWL